VRRLAAWVGDAAYNLAGAERRVALANLEIAFGGRLPDAEKARIARQCFRSCALVGLDLFWFSRLTRKRLQDWVTFDPSFEHYFQTRPGIAVTAHLGNWEVMGLATGLRGHPAASVAMPLANPFVDRAVNRIRGLTGQTVVERAGAARKLLRRLREGGRAAFLLDQNTLPAEGGGFAPFFGLPAPVSLAAEVLARRSGAPVVPAFCVEDGRGRYRAYAKPPIAIGADAGEGHAGTAAILATVEEEVRKWPDQWNWIYKRWKYIPAEAPAGRFPFYAERLRASR
jgi:KDO2-lipid IV(A) lauroyltransferase